MSLKTVVFLSNYFNHHQKSFSEYMHNSLGDGYKFIETEPMSEERVKMGWNVENFPPYVITSEEYEHSKEKCVELVKNADIVIIGSAPEWLIEERKKEKKLVFRYQERPLKNGFQPLKYFTRKIKWKKKNPKNCPIYMLCASAYTAPDYAKFGLFKNKCFKWGYFPERINYEDVSQLIKEKEQNSIIWVGRFIDWKHPEGAILLAKALKKDGYNFKIRMIGNGIMLDEIKKMATQYQVDDCVEFLGAMTPEEVRKYMEKSEIHIFTSDRKEGWGAVLNESMNSACVPVASHEIGSVPYLIESEKNGLIYKSKNNNDLYKNVRYLLNHQDERIKMAVQSYETIANEWNAEIAAERLLRLFSNMVESNTMIEISSGPISKG